MSVTPVRLYAGPVANGAPVTVYTAPADQIIVVRRLLVVAAVNANVTVTIAGVAVFSNEAVVANKRLEQQLEEAMAAGEAIAAGSSVAGALVLHVTGLSLPV